MRLITQLNYQENPGFDNVIQINDHIYYKRVLTLTQYMIFKFDVCVWVYSPYYTLLDSIARGVMPPPAPFPTRILGYLDVELFRELLKPKIYHDCQYYYLDWKYLDIWQGAVLVMIFALLYFFYF